MPPVFPLHIDWDTVISFASITGGLYKYHSHDIIPIDRCYIHSDRGNEFLPKVQGAREAMIRTSLSTGEVLIVKEGKANVPYIMDRMDDLVFKIRPGDFFQINPQQAMHLYKKAIDCVNLNASTRVLDAYCGVGCLSLSAAKTTRYVVAIESVASAIKSAKENAQLNDLNHIRFICGKVENYLSLLHTCDVIFCNPPRNGLNSAVIMSLNSSSLQHLIYISCDPATLSRDAKKLSEKFTIGGVYPFDMFPQTTHVETLVHFIHR